MKNEMGSMIRSYRDKNGMTQQELADDLGITKSLVSYIEAGKRNPSFHQLRKIAATTGAPLHKLWLASRKLKNPSHRLTEEQRQAFLRLGNGTSELKDELEGLCDVIAELAGEKLKAKDSPFLGPDGQIEYGSRPSFPTYASARSVFSRGTDLAGELAQCLRSAFHEVMGREMGGLDDVQMLLDRVLCMCVFHVPPLTTEAPLASYDPYCGTIELTKGQGQHPYLAAHEMFHRLFPEADSFPRAYSEDRTVRDAAADRGVFDLALPTERVSKHIVRSRIGDSTYRFMAATDLGVTVRMLEFKLMSLDWLTRSAIIRGYQSLPNRIRRAKAEGYYPPGDLWRDPIREEFNRLQRQGVLR